MITYGNPEDDTVVTHVVGGTPTDEDARRITMRALARQFRELGSRDRPGFVNLVKQALKIGVKHRQIIKKLKVSPPALSRWLHVHNTPLLEGRKLNQNHLAKRLEYAAGMAELLEELAGEGG